LTLSPVDVGLPTVIKHNCPNCLVFSFYKKQCQIYQYPLYEVSPCPQNEIQETLLMQVGGKAWIAVAGWTALLKRET